MQATEIDYPFKRFERLVELAHALIDKPEGREKHFTFLTKGSKIITIGFNNVFTQRVKIDHKTYWTYPFGGVHSELDAVAGLRDLSNVRKLTLTNIRVNRLRQLRYSKPCPVCQGFLSRLGFKTVYFSTDNGFARL